MALSLVDEVIESTELAALNDAVDNMIRTLLSNSPAAVKQAKQLALDVAYQEIDDALLNITSERIASIRVSEEGQEGLSAFFEKRAPKWQQEPSGQGS